MVAIGDVAPDFELVDHEGSKHRLSSYRGRRVLLSFYRFAACPVCLYSVERLRQQAEMLRNANVVVLCVFKSTPGNICRSLASSSGSGDGSIACLSDARGETFRSFTIGKSTRAMMHGVVSMMRNLGKYGPELHASNMMRDTRGMTNMGQLRQLPADFMIDEDGVIVDLFRAERMSDHMPFERVEAFIPKEKRCRCHRKDCIVSYCCFPLT